MNKHTLNYHTRLHDWYRQHSVQLEKQEVSCQQQQHQQQSDPAGTGEVAAVEAGNLTQDKLHAIHDWCADVNRNLFRVKKREAPPLFRRCRVTSASTVASGASSKGRHQGRSASLHFRPADPRRVRSAEVFTVTGHWARQPKARISGGELLAKRPMTAPRNNIYSAAAVERRPVTASTEELDLCVRNSRDLGDAQKTGQPQAHTLPRVNHDSLHLRYNALVLKQNGPRITERVPGSPRDSLVQAPGAGTQKALHSLGHKDAGKYQCVSCKASAADENMKRAKSAHPAVNSGTRLRFMDESGDVFKVVDSNGVNGDSNHHRTMEQAKNAKNEQYSRLRPGTCKVRGRQGRKLPDTVDMTGDSNKVTDNTGQPLPATNGGLDKESLDNSSTMRPGFCNTYSGVHPTPGEGERGGTGVSGECINSINVDPTQRLPQEQQQHSVGRKRESVRLSAEERLTRELKKGEAEVSQVEARLLENSVHYSNERADLREGLRGSVRPSTSSAAAFRARLAAQMAVDEEDQASLLEMGDAGSNGKSEYSDDDDSQDPEGDFKETSSCGDPHSGGFMEPAEIRKSKKGIHNAHVTILTDTDRDRENATNADFNNSANTHGNDEEERGEDRPPHTGGDDRIPSPTNNEEGGYAEDDDDEDEDMEPPDMVGLARARGGRRKSISFTYKPEVAAPSVSNSLLNVLSIDDCKFHMRYSPHKILEEHEITENLMLPLDLLQLNADDNGGDNTVDSNRNDNGVNPKVKNGNESGSKVAMRISRECSPENIPGGKNPRQKSSHTVRTGGERLGAVSPDTSIHSSTARHATAANVRKFQAMHDPNHLDFHSHQRPRSACLARAFHTLIHDRTIMQRIDHHNNNNINNNNNQNHTRGHSLDSPAQKNINLASGLRHSTKSPRPKKADGSGGMNARPAAKGWDSIEWEGDPKMEGGPRYRLINAALRRHMGDLMQEQCKRLQVRYQRQRSGACGPRVGGNKGGGGSGPPSVTPSLSLSLSLESLPQVKKGILKPSTSPEDGDPLIQEGVKGQESEAGSKEEGDLRVSPPH